MSRPDRMIARKREDKRPKQPIYHKAGPGRRKVYTLVGEVQYTSDKHSTGSPWWNEKLADLVERRQPDGSYEPVAKAAPQPVSQPTKPQMVPRPAGMTRQVQRALYRRLCKDVGVPWR